MRILKFLLMNIFWMSNFWKFKQIWKCHDMQILSFSWQVVWCHRIWHTSKRRIFLWCKKLFLGGTLFVQALHWPNDSKVMPLTNILEVELFNVRCINFMRPFPLSYGNSYIIVAVDYTSKWVEDTAHPHEWFQSGV